MPHAQTCKPPQVPKATREAGAVALQTEQLKHTKYTLLESSYHFAYYTVKISAFFIEINDVILL